MPSLSLEGPSFPPSLVWHKNWILIHEYRWLLYAPHSPQPPRRRKIKNTKKKRKRGESSGMAAIRILLPRLAWSLSSRTLVIFLLFCILHRSIHPNPNPSPPTPPPTPSNYQQRRNENAAKVVVKFCYDFFLIAIRSSPNAFEMLLWGELILQDERVGWMPKLLPAGI